MKRAPKPAARESNAAGQTAMDRAPMDRAAMDRAIDKAGVVLRSAVDALERVHEMPLKPKQRDKLADILVEQLQRLSMANFTALRVVK